MTKRKKRGRFAWKARNRVGTYHAVYTIYSQPIIQKSKKIVILYNINKEGKSKWIIKTTIYQTQIKFIKKQRSPSNSIILKVDICDKHKPKIINTKAKAISWKKK